MSRTWLSSILKLHDVCMPAVLVFNICHPPTLTYINTNTASTPAPTNITWTANLNFPQYPNHIQHGLWARKGLRKPVWQPVLRNLLTWFRRCHLRSVWGFLSYSPNNSIAPARARSALSRTTLPLRGLITTTARLLTLTDNSVCTLTIFRATEIYRLTS